MSQSLFDSLSLSFGGLWGGVASFLPSFILAIVVFVLGLLIASMVGRVVEKVFESVKLDSFLSKLGLTPYFERAGMQLKSARFLGRLVYWFIVVVFLVAVSDSLKLFTLSDFLRDLLNYIPNVVVAALMLLATVVLANFAKKVVIASVSGAKLKASKFLGAVVWWAIMVFGIISSLPRLGLDLMILNALVTGLIAMIALAGGLAFGLGGKEYASHLISKFKEVTEDK
jgi:small-conductance mechanosensitive channel